MKIKFFTLPFFVLLLIGSSFSKLGTEPVKAFQTKKINNCKVRKTSKGVFIVKNWVVGNTKVARFTEADGNPRVKALEFAKKDDKCKSDW